MHELAIAKDLAAIVLAEADKAGLSEVNRINIAFGQMVQIVPDIFRFAFREAVAGTVAEDSEIDIEIIPVKMRCSVCGEDFIVDDNKFACSKCSSTDIVLVQGKELLIKSIEGE